MNTQNKNAWLLRAIYLFITVMTLDLFFLPEGYPAIKKVFNWIKIAIGVVILILLIISSTSKRDGSKKTNKDVKFYRIMFASFFIVLLGVIICRVYLHKIPLIATYLYWLFLGGFIASSKMLDYSKD